MSMTIAALAKSAARIRRALSESEVVSVPPCNQGLRRPLGFSRIDARW